VYIGSSLWGDCRSHRFRFFIVDAVVFPSRRFSAYVDRPRIFSSSLAGLWRTLLSVRSGIGNREAWYLEMSSVSCLRRGDVVWLCFSYVFSAYVVCFALPRIFRFSVQPVSRLVAASVPSLFYARWSSFGHPYVVDKVNWFQKMCALIYSVPIWYTCIVSIPR